MFLGRQGVEEVMWVAGGGCGASCGGVPGMEERGEGADEGVEEEGEELEGVRERPKVEVVEM